MVMKTISCKYCGGVVVDGKQKYAHARRCELYHEEGIDHIVCKECGYRSTSLIKHIRLHGFDADSYRKKFPGAPIVMPYTVDKQSVARSSKGGYKSISQKRGAKKCRVCNGWYQPETAKRHLQECVRSHPGAYQEGEDHVACPECGIALLRLGEHLKTVHGWDRDRLALEKNRGLRLIAGKVAEKWRSAQDFEAAQKKREATHLARHGHANPFADPEVQRRLVETSRRRYGVDHPMRDEEVFIRNREANGVRPTGLEAFFDEHTPDNVVYTGYGARFVRTKVGVRKMGRVFTDLNPDFMVMSEGLAKKAHELSEGMEKFPRHWRPGKVVELLGTWWHSEKVTGIPEKVHEKELVEAYNGVGINCLVLWEQDVMDNWPETGQKVKEWLGWNL